ncbi:ubiquinone biosynthesis accessory factor UbiJ [Candidatus Rariloculus sp.]|uniref:ubiquinone biosynthesis accessory factor UbiJ n=1 Tax=Candidatus Rariloculus sp. TaxID=3101265 RepID=UPI003D1312B0
MILGTCQRLLNRSIADSTAAGSCAQRLEGESLAIHVHGLAIKVTLRVRGGELTISADDERSVSAEVKASPLDLLRLTAAGTLGQLRGTRAEFSGDLSVAEEFAELLRLANPDLEEALSGWIGDIAAHEIGSASRSLARWGRSAGRSLTASTAEYLQEESRVMPGRFEARAFYADVEHLRDDVERSAQRLDRIERALAGVPSR